MTLFNTASTTARDGRPTWLTAISEVLSTVAPAYGPTWADVVDMMRTDPDQLETVGELRRQLASDGEFRQPVVIDPDELTVSDGMHRIVATILSGTPHILITDRYTEAGNAEQLQIDFTATAPNYNDPIEFATAALSSFPLGGIWVNCDSFSSVNGVLRGHWYCPHEKADELVAALTQRAADRHAELQMSLVRLHVWDNEMDDWRPVPA
nr:hypothetical protein OG781_42750 [Streptomyces sp. NBC_00830]